jgi:hypothetical protein
MRKRTLAERLLYGVLAAQFCVIATGTVWALVLKPKTVPLSEFQGGIDEVEVETTPEQRVFTGIGRLRARLAAPSQKGVPEGGGAAVVVTIGFPYDSSDRAFLEELSMNARKFRSITTAYFNSIPADSLLLSDEAALKGALLSRYNDTLYLGKIETLFFSEFIIID